MTQQNDDLVPEQGQTPAPDATQQIPSEPTQALPNYAYPTASEAPIATDAQAATSASASSAPGAPLPGVALADEPGGGNGNGRGSRKGLLIGGLAAVLVLGAGGAFAVQKLSGGGAQPADVIPGDAYAYLRLDIDPSAGQKIAAVRFLNKLPQVKDNLGGEDMRKKIWETISKDDECAAKYDYVKDIEPWLGDRVGVALRPGSTSDEPNTVAALQVKDADKAKATITELAKCGEGNDDVDIVTKNDYLLFTNKGQGDATLAAIDKGSLSANANFSSDMNDLGEQGILSMWADGGPLAKDANKMTLADTALPSDFKGRLAAAVRFDPGYIELAGITRGVEGAKAVEGNGSELNNLPANTVGAMHIAGADKQLDQNWDRIKKSLNDLATSTGSGTADDLISQIEDEAGIKLPDDLKVLLGSQFTVAVPEQDFSNDDPKVGVKVVSSDATKANEIVGKIEDLSGASGMLTRKVEGDKLYVSTTSDYADDLKSGGKFGDSEVFKAALGDVSKANFAFIVDLDKIEKTYLSDIPAEAHDAVEALRAAGMNVSTTGDGSMSFSLRVVSN